VSVEGRASKHRLSGGHSLPCLDQLATGGRDLGRIHCCTRYLRRVITDNCTRGHRAYITVDAGDAPAIRMVCCTNCCMQASDAVVEEGVVVAV